jgi:cytochrome b6-f complex iron-sulfur subunit
MDQNSDKKNISRRKFLKGAIGGIVIIELGYVLYGLTGKKKNKLNASKLFVAGNVSYFEKDKIYPFSSGHFYLSRFEDGGFLAISTKCTHLGCMVQNDTNTGGFACPCHASKFNKHGEVVSPPAIRALDILPILIENGIIKVDTQNPIKRQKFDPSQLTYS